MTQLQVQKEADRLTERDLKIIELTAVGYNSFEIGAVVGNSKRTVENVIQALNDRFGVKNRTQLACLLMDAGKITYKVPKSKQEAKTNKTSKDEKGTEAKKASKPKKEKSA